MQHQRAEATCLHFGQHAHDLLIERQLAHVDKGNLQALGENLVQLLFADQVQIREYATELAAGALLLGQRLLQLLIGDDLVLEQQLAEADLLFADLFAHE